MRESDRERLSHPYARTPDERSASSPAEALQVDTPQLRGLEQEILDDLTPGPPYGIGWWTPHPGTSRRILIGDQLYACVMSTSENLIEAALHWLEFVDYADQESDWFADVVKVERGEVAVKARPSLRPLDDVILKIALLHRVGVVRALSGALDCLAGVIIGIVSLPNNILRADFNRVRQTLRKLPKPSTDGQQIQAEFGAKLEQLIANVGPTGWLDWTLAFRNMLVHRGRRYSVSQFVPRNPPLYGPNGRLVPRVRVVNQLPRDPGRSDVEVFLDPAISPVLTEGAEQTLDGLIKSTQRLVDGTAGELQSVWKWRRAHPDLLHQARTQWADGVSTVSEGFLGYAQGSYPYHPSMLMSHPVIGRRLRAAALDDRARGNWRTFD